MILEEYNQLSYDYAHCAGTHCEKASQCLHHTAYTMLGTIRREKYMIVNEKVITGCTALHSPARSSNPTARNALRGAYRASTTTCGRLTCAVPDTK